ncbi:AraC family transcriptional regulator [Spartinivicinus poritis]|uniref:AraC family transcriptional regulator n=1 Tax=Spartinivicinus poritis TaxID=2994640 RepID=A0ABT5UBS5_9GAMM|nr:AraC family transcriptional regulator [Spartinivicinus sp. A2-2]MDE1463836.1 AraC family transcriptional regulator [Spartinivicinus sp. A2-2]
MNDSSTIVLEQRRYQTGALTHHHDFHQLILPVAGQLHLKLNQSEQWVNQQHCAIIPAGADHTFEGQADNLFLVADVPSNFSYLIEQLPTAIQMNHSIANYAQFLNQELAIHQMSPTTPILSAMIQLLIQLLHEQGSSGLFKIDARATLVKEYIDSHYAENLTLGQLAALVHLSPRQLSTVFKKAYGLPPLHYQLQRRMKQAQHLLRTSNLTIQKIAESVGYGNLSAFSDRFRRYFGHAPRYYR